MPPLVRIHPFQYGEAEVTSVEEVSLPDEDSVVEEAFGCPDSESDDDDIIYEIPCPKCGDPFNGRNCTSCDYETEEKS